MTYNLEKFLKGLEELQDIEDLMKQDNTPYDNYFYSLP